MKWYAIQHKSTKKFISDTNYKHSTPRQILASELRPPLLIPYSRAILKVEVAKRKINYNSYKVITVEVSPSEQPE